MKTISFRIDKYRIRLYGADNKGARTRWGDKAIDLYSEGTLIGEAVFAAEGESPPDSFFAEGKIHYFASNSQYPVVINLLRNEKYVTLNWKPVSDPREPGDGDAFFETGDP
ncbi:MAG: hypothetical protein JXB26_13810 [Candidatus Aminicenantes bacterium]|nr:hypothetical protein [Candidatus Aminicenantes bacterium]